MVAGLTKVEHPHKFQMLPLYLRVASSLVKVAVTIELNLSLRVVMSLNYIILTMYSNILMHYESEMESQ